VGAVSLLQIDLFLNTFFAIAQYRSFHSALRDVKEVFHSLMRSAPPSFRGTLNYCVSLLRRTFNFQVSDLPLYL